jgi:superfamily II DNA or RNA helicase
VIGGRFCIFAKVGVEFAPMLRIKPWQQTLRPWQQQALTVWQQRVQAEQPNFLLEATPGSGKTSFALCAAHSAISQRWVTRLLVVCPTAHLKQQWASAAHQAGLALLTDWAGQQLPSDYHGLVVTYHQVATQAKAIARLLLWQPCLVVFDEIHHAANEQSWGESLLTAFRAAKLRLLLSGTPFRSDNAPIPFVTYQEDRSQADFVYGYREALADEVVRPVAFATYDGEIGWQLPEQASRTVQISQVLSPLEHATRQRILLNPSGAWFKQALTDANARLHAIRQHEQNNAAGLIITPDTETARQAAQQVQVLTGQKAVVVVSEDADASALLRNFGQQALPWLVAVRMVSEGVDIPRLRVMLYSTNITTRMYFRQAVGRVVRRQPQLKGEQLAYFYLPALPELTQHAREIEQIVQAQLRRNPADGLFDRLPTDSLRPTDASLQRQEVLPLFTAIADPVVIYQQQKLAGPQLPHAALFVTAEQLASPPPAPPDETLDAQKEKLRQQIAKLVGQLVQRERGKASHRDVYAQLLRLDGQTQESCTLIQLQKRVRYLQQRLHTLR